MAYHRLALYNNIMVHIISPNYSMLILIPSSSKEQLSNRRRKRRHRISSYLGSVLRIRWKNLLIPFAIFDIFCVVSLAMCTSVY